LGILPFIKKRRHGKSLQVKLNLIKRLAKKRGHATADKKIFFFLLNLFSLSLQTKQTIINSPYAIVVIELPSPLGRGRINNIKIGFSH